MQTGVCYFPEHWPRERWARDVERMGEAGFDYVRMGEFAWSRLEPTPGEYDLDWLAEAVELVDDAGMAAVLCTPTATPPKWLVDAYPGIRQERPDGTPLEFGSRRHYCFNSPTYRRESRRIVERLAGRFADVDGVAGWQTDNEFGCHGTVRCHCDDCTTAFREWLRDRYGSIERLNEAWGNAFWSQEYTSFREVDVPGPTPAEHHPSRRLDYARFASDSVVDYQRVHLEPLRAANDDWFVTHNFMGDFEPLDAFDASAELEFAAWDSYPTLHAQRAPDTPDPDEPTPEAAALQRVGAPDVTGMNHALFRGASDGPFWVMEHQAGDVRAFPYAAEPADGMIRLWSHQSVAHGADVVSYFRWRRCRFAQEQYWGALRNYDGSPDRGLVEATVAADEFDALPDLAAPAGDVALLVDYDSMWALHHERHAPEFDYWAHLRTYFGALRRRGVTVDLVGAGSGGGPGRDVDLDAYAAVVAPALHLVDDAFAARLADYVAGGGELCATVRTATKDRNDVLRDELAPGPLATAAGVRVEQHESLAPGLETRASYDGETYDYRTWAEWLRPEDADATVVGRHETGVAAGEPAVVRNPHGVGHVVTVGVWPGAAMADAVTDALLDRAGVPAAERLPDSVRLTERDGHTWVLNFGTEPVEVDADGDGEVVLGDATVPGRDLSVLAAPAHEVRVSVDGTE